MYITFNNLFFVGLILFILGIGAAVKGTYSKGEEETVAKMGEMELTAKTEKHYNLNPYVSGFLIISGIAVLIASQQKIKG